MSDVNALLLKANLKQLRVPYLALIVFPSEYSRIAIRFPNLSYTHNSANSTTPNELATPLFDPAPRSTFRTSYLATTPPLPHAGTITIFGEASVWAASCNGSTAAPRIGARWPNNSNSRTVPTARPSVLSFSMASCTDSTRPVPTEKPSAPVASSAATAMSGPVADTLSASGSSTKSDGLASLPTLSGAFSNAPLPVPLPPPSAPPTATCASELCNASGNASSSVKATFAPPCLHTVDRPICYLNPNTGQSLKSSHTFTPPSPTITVLSPPFNM
jgi:hypothetical protein